MLYQRRVVSRRRLRPNNSFQATSVSSLRAATAARELRRQVSGEIIDETGDHDVIAHMSVPSENPKETALFFAAVIDGLAFDFPVVPGASIAVARDGSGTAVEVYPIGMAHHPGVGQPDPALRPSGPTTMPWEDQIYAAYSVKAPSTFHMAVETKLSESEVMSRARSLGWRTLACNRAGAFGVVEVWVDNTYLIEVLVEGEAARYRSFMNIAGCASMFGAGIAPEQYSADT